MVLGQGGFLELAAVLYHDELVVSLANILLEAPEPDVVIDPMTWFPSPGAFELEIGCGKGGFLLSRARAQPHIRLLGIELKKKVVEYCADRISRWQIENARVTRVDARVFVMRNLPPGCLSLLHMYHPDPWPKKRHHKRRLVQPDFVEAAVNVLIPGGRWMVQSDHDEYFQHMVAVLGAHRQLRPIPWEMAEADPGPDWKGTNFEVKFSKRGHPILRAAYQRLPRPVTEG